MQSSKYSIDDVVGFHDLNGNFIFGKIQCIVIPPNKEEILYYIGYGLSQIKESEISHKLP